MGKPVPEQAGDDRRVHRSNQAWKKRWNTWLARSLVVAAAAHVILFVAWPVWSITYNADREKPELEMVQLRPVASFGVVDGSIDSPTTALRTAEEIEFDAARSGAGEEEPELTEDEILEQMFQSIRPSVVYSAASMVEGGEQRTTTPAATRLDLELAEVTTRLATLPPTVAYPLIRNPVAVTRFLRSEYNPIYQTAGTTGTATVMMWVNERGDVDWSEISESSGDPALDDIALELFNEVAVFRAARAQGSRIAVALVISVPLTAPW